MVDIDPERKDEKKIQIYIDEELTFQGSCWFMKKSILSFDGLRIQIVGGRFGMRRKR